MQPRSAHDVPLGLVTIFLAGCLMLGLVSGPLAGYCQVSNPAETTSDESASEEEIRDDFDSRCVGLERNYRSRKDPELFFFSSADHRQETLGCSPRERFTLIPFKPDGSAAKVESNPDKWQLNEEEMRQVFLESGQYNPTWPTYMIVHGFLASWNSDPWMCNLKDEILNKTQANVFIVDWSGGSKPMLPIDYSSSVADTKYIGQLLAKFVADLLTMSGQPDASRFHLIGHSLGAHISGFVGYALNGKSLGRITGLDPAGPCFSGGKRKNSLELRQSGRLSDGRLRLSMSCANQVVAIHTDANKFGLDEDCAHYDIYVNGGRTQPSCVAQSLHDRFDDMIEMKPADVVNVKDMTCSHSFSHELTKDFLPSASMLAHAHAHAYGSLLQSDKYFTFQWDKSDNRIDDSRCWLVAYHCSSWSAFKRGECGLAAPTVGARDQGGHAFVVALKNPTTNQGVAAEPEVPPTLKKDAPREEPTESDDEHVNGEEVDVLHARNAEKKTEKISEDGQFFIRTSHDDSLSTCAFTYQIVIATRPTQPDARKFYLSLPLASDAGRRSLTSDLLAMTVTDGTTWLSRAAPSERLVQVSHKIQRNYVSWSQLGAIFERVQSEGMQELDYYTALITFDAATDDECRHSPFVGPQRTAAKDRKHWYLCRPLSTGIHDARLWAKDFSTLQEVEWVALTYLSGPNATVRRVKSFLMAPNLRRVKRGEPRYATTSFQDSDKKKMSFARRTASRIKHGSKRLLERRLSPILAQQCPADANGCASPQTSSQQADLELQYSVPLRETDASTKNRVIQV